MTSEIIGTDISSVCDVKTVTSNKVMSEFPELNSISEKHCGEGHVSVGHSHQSNTDEEKLSKKKHQIPQETIKFLKMLKKKNPKKQSSDKSRKPPTTLVTHPNPSETVSETPAGDNNEAVKFDLNKVKVEDGCEGDEVVKINKVSLQPESLALLQSERERKKGEPGVRSVLYKYSQHHDKGWYICPRDNCQFRSRHSKNVYTHEKTHTGDRKYCCNLCGKTFVLMKNFKLHQAVHNDIRNFQCDWCHKRFRNKANLDRHMLTHTGEKPYVCFEENCGAAFKDKSNLKKHVALKHHGEKPFECKAKGCDYVAYDVHSLKRHELKHKNLEDRPTEKCAYCGKVLYGTRSLKSHMLIHKGESMQCPFCPYTSVFKQALLAHTMRKHGMDLDGKVVERKYRCNKCEFSTFWEHDLKFHMAKHGKHRPFKCPICDYSTVLKGSLQKHMRLHTGEQPFSCQICGKGYTNQSGLARHRRAHTGEKPHKCDVCGKRYADLKTLRVHHFSHMNVKPYICHLCTYTCTKKEVLVTHFRRVHGESTMPDQLRPRAPIRVIMRVTSGQTADEIVNNIAPRGLGERQFMVMSEDSNDHKFMVIEDNDGELLERPVAGATHNLIDGESVFRIIQTEDGQTTVDSMNSFKLGEEDEGDERVKDTELHSVKDLLDEHGASNKQQPKVMKIATAARSPSKHHSSRQSRLSLIGEPQLYYKQSMATVSSSDPASPVFQCPAEGASKYSGQPSQLTVTGQMTSVGALGQKFVIVSGEEANLLKSLELDDSPQLIAIPVATPLGNHGNTGADSADQTHHVSVSGAGNMLTLQNLVLESSHTAADDKSELASLVEAVNSVEAATSRGGHIAEQRAIADSLIHMPHPILEGELMKGGDSVASDAAGGVGGVTLTYSGVMSALDAAEYGMQYTEEKL